MSSLTFACLASRFCARLKLSLIFLGRRKINPAGTNQSESNSFGPHHNTGKFCSWLQAVATADQRRRETVFSLFLPAGAYRLPALLVLSRQRYGVPMSVGLRHG